MANDKQTERIQDLAKKWQEGTITPEEKLEFEAWYDAQDNTYELNTAENKEQTEQRILDQLLEKANIKQPKTTRLWPRIAAAASIILAIGAGSYFIIHNQQPQQQIAQRTDIKPGTNQATLTLANGQKIVLNAALNGQIAKQAGAIVTVNKGSNIIYSTAATREVVYNTLSTARGQQSPYPLVLADGTKIWLNAASSITFPTAFIGAERKVTITGEAYVEVAHNSKQPFEVSVNGQTIEDIGTEFNINAYTDEPNLKTTLISGSVKITAGDHSVTLKPSQQSITANNTIKVQTVDTEGITAWKNNYFLFDDNNLESIMRQVARWYNVDIKYENETAKAKMLTGTISRYKNVSSVLKKIELTGAAHFKIDGNQIIVTN